MKITRHPIVYDKELSSKAHNQTLSQLFVTHQQRVVLLFEYNDLQEDRQYDFSQRSTKD